MAVISSPLSALRLADAHHVGLRAVQNSDFGLLRFQHQTHLAIRLHRVAVSVARLRVHHLRVLVRVRVVVVRLERVRLHVLELEVDRLELRAVAATARRIYCCGCRGFCSSSFRCLQLLLLLQGVVHFGVQEQLAWRRQLLLQLLWRDLLDLDVLAIPEHGLGRLVHQRVLLEALRNLIGERHDLRVLDADLLDFLVQQLLCRHVRGIGLCFESSPCC